MLAAGRSCKAARATRVKHVRFRVAILRQQGANTARIRAVDVSNKASNRIGDILDGLEGQLLDHLVGILQSILD